MEMSIAYHIFAAQHRGWHLSEPYSEGFAARHVRKRHPHRGARRLAAAAVVLLAGAAALALPGSPAHAAPPAYHAVQAIADQGPGGQQGAAHRACGWRCYPRTKAIDWALTQKGHAYCWGGTGPCYDCSGLVVTAYRHAGFGLPRTTYDILAAVGVRHYRRHIWWVLVQVWHPRRGDLAFYGPGHVELATKLHDTTFGAHDSGSPVSYARWGWGWVPTEFLRLVVHRRR